MTLATVKSSTPQNQECHYRTEGSYFNPSIICLLYRGGHVELFLEVMTEDFSFASSPEQS